MIIASIVTDITGIFVFLFIFWKHLREDYSPEIIFKAVFDILAGIFIGFLVSLKFMPHAFFWAVILGGLVGLGVSIFRLKLKFYEVFEALIISSLPWLSFIFLLDSVTHSSLNSFIAFIATLIFVFISYFLDAHYKNFVWYKSGRIGFSGVATLGLFFITRSLLAIFRINVISFVSLGVEAILSGVAALICLVLLFNLTNAKK